MKVDAVAVLAAVVVLDLLVWKFVFLVHKLQGGDDE